MNMMFSPLVRALGDFHICLPYIPIRCGRFCRHIMTLCPLDSRPVPHVPTAHQQGLASEGLPEGWRLWRESVCHEWWQGSVELVPQNEDLYEDTGRNQRLTRIISQNGSAWVAGAAHVDKAGKHDKCMTGSQNGSETARLPTLVLSMTVNASTSTTANLSASYIILRIFCQCQQMIVKYL